MGKNTGNLAANFYEISNFYVANVKIRGCCIYLQQPFLFLSGINGDVGDASCGDAHRDGASCALAVHQIPVHHDAVIVVGEGYQQRRFRPVGASCVHGQIRTTVSVAEIGCGDKHIRRCCHRARGVKGVIQQRKRRAGIAGAMPAAAPSRFQNEVIAAVIAVAHLVFPCIQGCGGDLEGIADPCAAQHAQKGEPLMMDTGRSVAESVPPVVGRGAIHFRDAAVRPHTGRVHHESGKHAFLSGIADAAEQHQRPIHAHVVIDKPLRTQKSFRIAHLVVDNCTEIPAAAVVGVGLQGTAQGCDVRVVFRLIVTSQNDGRVAEDPCEHDGVGGQLVGGAPCRKTALPDFLADGEIVFLIAYGIDNGGIQNTGFHLPHGRCMGAPHEEPVILLHTGIEGGQKGPAVGGIPQGLVGVSRRRRGIAAVHKGSAVLLYGHKQTVQNLQGQLGGLGHQPQGDQTQRGGGGGLHGLGAGEAAYKSVPLPEGIDDIGQRGRPQKLLAHRILIRRQGIGKDFIECLLGKDRGIHLRPAGEMIGQPGGFRGAVAHKGIDLPRLVGGEEDGPHEQIGVVGLSVAAYIFVGCLAGRAGFGFPVAAQKLPDGGTVSPPRNAVFVAVSVGQGQGFPVPSDLRCEGGGIRPKGYGRVGYCDGVDDGTASARAGDHQLVCGGIGGYRQRIGGKGVGIQGDFSLGYAGEGKGGVAFGPQGQLQILPHGADQLVFHPITRSAGKRIPQCPSAHHVLACDLALLSPQERQRRLFRQEQIAVIRAIPDKAAALADRLCPYGVGSVLSGGELHGGKIMESQLLSGAGVVVGLDLNQIRILVYANVGNIAVYAILPFQFKPIGVQGQILRGKPGEVEGFRPLRGEMGRSVIVAGKYGQVKSRAAHGVGGVDDPRNVGGVGPPGRQGHVVDVGHGIKIRLGVGDETVIHCLPSQISGMDEKTLSILPY